MFVQVFLFIGLFPVVSQDHKMIQRIHKKNMSCIVVRFCFFLVKYWIFFTSFVASNETIQERTAHNSYPQQGHNL